jgi:hypothetical protein
MPFETIFRESTEREPAPSGEQGDSDIQASDQTEELAEELTGETDGGKRALEKKSRRVLQCLSSLILFSIWIAIWTDRPSVHLRTVHLELVLWARVGSDMQIKTP